MDSRQVPDSVDSAWWRSVGAGYFLFLGGGAPVGDAPRVNRIEYMQCMQVERCLVDGWR